MVRIVEGQVGIRCRLLRIVQSNFLWPILQLRHTELVSVLRAVAQFVISFSRALRLSISESFLCGSYLIFLGGRYSTLRDQSHVVARHEPSDALSLVRGPWRGFRRSSGSFVLAELFGFVDDLFAIFLVVLLGLWRVCFGATASSSTWLSKTAAASTRLSVDLARTLIRIPGRWSYPPVMPVMEI